MEDEMESTAVLIDKEVEKIEESKSKVMKLLKYALYVDSIPFSEKINKNHLLTLIKELLLDKE